MDEHKAVFGWPSGLRRWFKAPVSSGAWVRIPLRTPFCSYNESAIGLVVKYLVANEVPRVRFPDGALLAFVAQLAARGSHNPKVAGSTPVESIFAPWAPSGRSEAKRVPQPGVEPGSHG